MVGGKKHGQGMYIYADLTAYKGVWDEDRLNGVMHPMGEEQLPVEVALELQFSITRWNIQMVYCLKYILPHMSGYLLGNFSMTDVSEFINIFKSGPQSEYGDIGIDMITTLEMQQNSEKFR